MLRAQFVDPWKRYRIRPPSSVAVRVNLQETFSYAAPQEFFQLSPNLTFA